MKLKLLTTLIFIAATAAAHDLYLQAAPFFLTEPGSVNLSMYLAASFPGEEQKWRADKTAAFQVLRPQDSQKAASIESTNPKVTLSSEGTYVIGWSSTPSHITIEPKELEQYVTAEGYKNVLEARKAAGTSNAKASEKYTRNLKIFVQVGDTLTSNAGIPLGTKIEIVPKQNPYALKVGDELTVQVLFDGKPLQDVRVMGTYDTFSKEHDVYAQTAQTDSNGIARIKIAKPGIWLIRANHMLPASGDSKAEWESFWANCSFHVR